MRNKKEIEVLLSKVALLSKEQLMAKLYKFYKYSLRNIILIALQKPDATQVAGLKQWNKLGRYVNKGEKGLIILAPYFKKVKDEETEEESVVLKGFIPVYVFDISQTNGKPLPTKPHRITMLTEEKAQDILSVLQKHFKAYFCSMDYEINGYVNSNKEIAINIGNSIPSQAITFVHEAAHSLLDHIDNRHEITTELKEVEAELVTYLVFLRMGISVPSEYYIKYWVESRLEFTQESINLIDKAVSKLCKVLAVKEKEVIENEDMCAV